ncbi:MAG TPA: hypothetical protein VMV54_06075 [Acidocella sp.]|nr:hypothetical protein [Acidocella sp.]
MSFGVKPRPPASVRTKRRGDWWLLAYAVLVAFIVAASIVAVSFADSIVLIVRALMRL